MNLTIEEANKMKVSELKIALQVRGAATTGLKAVLLERLLELIENEDTSRNAGVCEGSIIFVLLH